MYTPTLRLSLISLAVLALLSLIPFLAGAQERTNTNDTTIEANASLEADTNICDGATCADGSCAATPAECGAEEAAVDSVCNGYLCDNGECATSEAMCGVLEEEIDMAVDSVCNGYLCDDGQCVSDEAWCGIDFDFEVPAGVAADSVCNGYLCNDGTCASSAAMCEMNFDELEAAVATCPAGSPIRCGDGSCSNDAERCLALEERREQPASNGDRARNINGDQLDEVNEELRRDADSDGDGLDDGTERANYNNSRSNKSKISDADGDGFADETETTRGVGEDCDDDESCARPDEASPAQNHNSSRSNRHNLREVFSDTDADSRPEVSFRGGAFVNVSNDPPTASAQSDGTDEGGVYCWGRGEDSEGQIYAWGRGICIASEATANASGTAKARLAALQVRGDDVRDWSDEQRTAWQEFRQTRATSTSDEHLIARIVEKALANERIQEVSADDQEVGMEYQADMRLFGIIPLQRTVNARATASGEVTIDYPWYRFLSRVPEQSVIQETLRELQSLQVGGGGAGKATFQDISR